MQERNKRVLKMKTTKIRPRTPKNVTRTKNEGIKSGVEWTTFSHKRKHGKNATKQFGMHKTPTDLVTNAGKENKLNEGGNRFEVLSEVGDTLEVLTQATDTENKLKADNESKAEKQDNKGGN